jgi:hypothetical protein
LPWARSFRGARRGAVGDSKSVVERMVRHYRFLSWRISTSSSYFVKMQSFSLGNVAKARPSTGIGYLESDTLGQIQQTLLSIFAWAGTIEPLESFVVCGGTVVRRRRDSSSR